MKSKVLNQGAQRTLAIIFDEGDEVTTGLLSVAKEHGLGGSSFTAIGAFSDVTLGFFDRTIKDYRRIRIDEQVEVLSLIGDIALSDDGPKVHAHVVVGKSDATAHGGHLLEAHVWPTLEVILTETPEHLQRRHDQKTGLALIEL
jgi:predicted DNA-binding protein with PD1-like motif